MGEITKLNIFRKLGEIKKLIRTWHSRNLTPYCKVTILKSLLMSKLTHMLLSLPSPNDDLVSELNALFADFLWANRPPKLRREILGDEIRDGGLKHHNIKLFETAMKLGWLKRFIKSSSKWTVFPNAMELGDVFTYGPNFIDRIVEFTSNPFWKNVLAALKTLWSSNCTSNKDAILETPVWHNPAFSL